VRPARTISPSARAALAGVALLNGCGDRLEISRAEKFTAFCDLGGGRKRHKTGRSIELRDISFAVGLAQAVGPLTCGAFFEGAFADSLTENGLDDGIGQRMGPSPRRRGAFCVMESEQSVLEWLHLEVALRIGTVKSLEGR
jgi:hypothetical protein